MAADRRRQRAQYLQVNPALYELTIYDAAYLELAQRKRLPLATLDIALARAARAAGVETLGQ
jgi:predicted nucleic acid-binding protein